MTLYPGIFFTSTIILILVIQKECWSEKQIIVWCWWHTKVILFKLLKPK